MSRNYDNWEKLVGAVLRREKDRQLAYCESFSSSCSDDFSSRFSLDSHLQHEASVNSGQNIFFSRSVMTIEYEELKNAVTMVLGRGRFGTVYKGYIDEHYAAAKPGSGIAVAVKELNSKSNVYPFFQYEMKSCLSHRHPNLVTLIGYSFSFRTHNPILVFELMPKGNLHNQLFEVDESLSWATRIKVALGVARALAFYHGLEFIHGNIRSSKIFLDDDFNAKLRSFDSVLSHNKDPLLHHPNLDVADFHQNAFAAVHSHTYMPSRSKDVYGFGIVLLELTLGLPASDEDWPSEERRLPYGVRSHLMNRKNPLIMDKRLKGKYPAKEAYEVVQIALQCVDLTEKLRPSMAEVVVALENLQKTSKSRLGLGISGGKFLRYKL